MSSVSGIVLFQLEREGIRHKLICNMEVANALQLTVTYLYTFQIGHSKAQLAKITDKNFASQML
jgi:hypothetical protein